MTTCSTFSLADDLFHMGAEIGEYQYISKTTHLSKVEKAKKNMIYTEGKKVNQNKIEYIQAHSYDHHDNAWSGIEDYRIYEKYKEGVNAYNINIVTPDYIGVLTLSKYYQKLTMGQGRSTPKGTVDISAYFLHCNKEKNNNPQLKNRYF